MKGPQGFTGRRVGRLAFARRQRVWLLWGAALGAVLVCLWQWPRWTAWLQWWQRTPLPAQQLAFGGQQAATATWAQHEAGLDDARTAAQHWRELRDRFARQGLQVLQWQVIEGPPPTPAAWPLVVQRARLQLQGDAGALPAVGRSAVLQGGLWRLDSLSGQAHAGEGGQSVWRWQAEWSLALRPAQGPAGVLARVGSTGPAPAPGSAPFDAPGSGQEPVRTGLPDAAAPAASVAFANPGPFGSSAQGRGVRGEGLHITDWPLMQLQWVGLWTDGVAQEAIFRAQERLFRVRPGEAIGQDGHRWVGGDARQLVLVGPPAAAGPSVSTSLSAPVSGSVPGALAGRTATAAGAASTTTLLSWEEKP